MKVLTIIYDLGLGGTQRNAINFACAYQSAGMQSAVYAFKSSGAREKQLQSLRVPLFFNLQEAQNWNADIIHIHRWGNEDSETAEILQKLKTEKNRIIETNVFSWVDRSQARQLIDVHFHPSTWAFWKWQSAVGGLSPTPFACVIPFLVDPLSFTRSTEQEKKEIRMKLKIPQNAFVYGRVGQPSLGKWNTSILYTFQEVAQTNEHVYLIMAEPPPEFKKIIRSFPKGIVDRILSFPSMTDDESLRRFYSSMDVFLHASLIGESFGMVLAEAMLCGIPVITESTPRVDNTQVEMVGHQKGGLVVSQEKYLVQAMQELLINDHLRSSLSAHASVSIHKRFSAESVIPLIQQIFKILLESKDPKTWQNQIKDLPKLVSQVSTDEILLSLSGLIGPTSWRDYFYLKFPILYLILRRGRQFLLRLQK